MLRKLKPILLVESNQADRHGISEAFGALDKKYTLLCANSGEEALNYLTESTKLRPWLILLGWNSNNGEKISFLREVKADSHLKNIPVVVIAQSENRKNLIEGFDLGIAGFMVKHREVSSLAETIEVIMRYWNLSELPPDGA